MIGGFARLRRPLRAIPESACLERGEVGLDGVPTFDRRRSRRWGWGSCRAATVTVVTSSLACFLVYGARVARAHAVSEAQFLSANGDRSSPCTHFQTDWMRAVTLRASGVTMTSPRVVSRGSEKVRTAETIDDASCRGKRIIRDRHAALSVAFVPLERWPWGSEEFKTLNDAAAVCVQHALEDFERRITCDTQ